MNQIEFAKCMKRLSSFYFKDFSSDDLLAWYDLFKNVKEDILNEAINNIVRESKFMPNINQLLEQCKNTTKSFYFLIADKMFKDGYFKRGIVPLDPEHEIRNYEKTIKWIEKGTIPQFLLDDMKEYMRDDMVVIEDNKSFLIGD